MAGDESSVAGHQLHPLRPAGSPAAEPAPSPRHMPSNGSDNERQPTPRQERTMDVATLAARRPDVLILDVRHPHEWDAGRIEGAVHIPLDELEERLDELDAARPLVAVC